MKRLRVVRGWKDVPPPDRGAALAMGVFDGVHKGHQRVIEMAGVAARELGVAHGVITFDPHPRDYFHPDNPTGQLMKPDQQARALEALGVDVLYVLPLNAELAGMTDREFATEVLHRGLGARHVAIGFDNTFGKGRTGDPAAMRRYGDEMGFSVSVAPALEIGGSGEKYSSTRAREALREGRPQEAAEVLGRPFAIEGEVQRGRQLGRKLGFPTANVSIAGYVTPRFGVYATRTHLPDGRKLPGVASLGVNPTIPGEIEPVLEVWLFDFDEDLYDQFIETELIAFLRPEQKFPDIESMKRQVLADADAARKLLGA